MVSKFTRTRIPIASPKSLGANSYPELRARPWDQYVGTSRTNVSTSCQMTREGMTLAPFKTLPQYEVPFRCVSPRDVRLRLAKSGGLDDRPVAYR